MPLIEPESHRKTFAVANQSFEIAMNMIDDSKHLPRYVCRIAVTAAAGAAATAGAVAVAQPR